MALEKTPICNFDESAKSFNLKAVDENYYNLENIKGEKGTLIMFICNHCPYVKAIIKELSDTVDELEKYGIKSVGIMSNDTIKYPDDSFENMKQFAKENNFNFPYLIDETQQVAKDYGAVCTPDFFGYNSDLKLQYRGRLRPLRDLSPIMDGENELLEAMITISENSKGPRDQNPSMGCNIKWK